MDVFVYGTLTEPSRATSILESFSFVGPATLHGLHRVEGAYPTLAPGGRVEGRLLRTADVASLDRYEGADRGLYVRVSVPLEPTPPKNSMDGEHAAVYVGNPSELSVSEPVVWPGDGSFLTRVERYVSAHEVFVSLD